MGTSRQRVTQIVIILAGCISLPLFAAANPFPGSRQLDPPTDRRRDEIAPTHRAIDSPAHEAEALRKLRKTHAGFKAISTVDNMRFIELEAKAATKAPRDMTVYLAENSVLKDLNDKVVGDYETVTALSNLHKTIVYRLIMRDADLRDRLVLVSRYHDFKGIAFAFSGLDGSQRIALRALHRRAGDIFGRIVSRSAVRQQLSGWRGITGDPRHWFAGGIGSDYDEATAAARLTRSRYNPRKRALIFEFRRVAGALDAEVVRAEMLRQQLQDRLDQGLLSRLNDGQRTLAVGVIDILRKARSVQGGLTAYIGHVQRRVRERFPSVKLGSANDILLMRDYFQAVDRFSPNLLIARRVEIDLSKASHSVLSVDLRGQGARNHYETQTAVYEARKQGAKDALRRSREGEERATHAMNRASNHIDRVTLATFGPAASNDLASGRTGDDMRYAPIGSVTLDARKSYLGGLSRFGQATTMFRSTEVRMSYADGGKRVPDDQRSALVKTAEGMLSQLEQRLEAGGMHPSALLHLRLEPREHGPHRATLSAAGVCSRTEKRALRRTLAQCQSQAVASGPIEYFRPQAPAVSSAPCASSPEPPPPISWSVNALRAAASGLINTGLANTALGQGQVHKPNTVHPQLINHASVPLPKLTLPAALQPIPLLASPLSTLRGRSPQPSIQRRPQGRP